MLKYRWPLLCIRGGRGSPTLYPGNLSAQPLAQIDGCLIQGPFGCRRPQLDGVTVAVTAMAVVAAQRQVCRKIALALGGSLMQGTAAVPLHARTGHGLEPEQVEDLGHGDLGTKAVEVDTWHATTLLGDRQLG